MTPLECFMCVAVPIVWVTALAKCFDWSMRDILTWIIKIPRNVLATAAIVLVSPVVVVQSAFESYELSEVPGNVISQAREIITEIRDLWTLRVAWSVKMPLVEIDPVGRIRVPETWPTGEAVVNIGLTEYDDWPALTTVNTPTATNGFYTWMGTPATTTGTYQYQALTTQELYNQIHGDPMQYVKTPPKASLSSITPTPEHRVH